MLELRRCLGGMGLGGSASHGVLGLQSLCCGGQHGDDEFGLGKL